MTDEPATPAADDTAAPQTVSNPTPQVVSADTPPPADVKLPQTGDGDQDLAATDNPGDDLHPDDLAVADPDPEDTPNPYTGGDVVQDDEAVVAP